METEKLDECHSFGILKESLRLDLQDMGFSNSEAGAILNWFNPRSPKYLEHVDAWQRLLCQGASPDMDFPLARRNVFGSVDLFGLPAFKIAAIHQVAKLVYKFHGIPRKETDWGEVKNRLSQPLPITLDNSEIQGIRGCLSGIRPWSMEFVMGRFGPGSTAEGFNSYQKWARLGGIPLGVAPSVFRVNSRDPWTPTHYCEGITKIAEVPKSIKSNRIVSSEPAMYMLAQLGCAKELDTQLHRHFRGHVSLHDQTRHNSYLLKPTACSIDLSDASDHVSVDLVQAVLPQLWPILASVRSSFSLFPDGEIIRLGTFAPMGSGVCFPVLTLVCLGICSYAAKVIQREKHLKKSDTWYVFYGDDGIVPVCMYDYVCDLLARAGLVVNKQKSCCTGIYRESCGKEMYLSQDITPAYIRDPLSCVDAAKIEQVCTRLEERLFFRTAEQVALQSGVVRRLRFNRNLQRMEMSVRSSTSRQKIHNLDDWDGLNRWFRIHAINKVDLLRQEMEPSGVTEEVWTRPSWRFKAASDYPFLWRTLVRALNQREIPQISENPSPNM